MQETVPRDVTPDEFRQAYQESRRSIPVCIGRLEAPCANQRVYDQLTASLRRAAALGVAMAPRTFIGS